MSSQSIKDVDAFLRTMRDRFRSAREALTEIHEEAREDFRFRAGEQWDKAVEAKRKQDGRPCYTINRIPQFLRQVTGQQRQSRPAVEVSPLGDNADVETAKILQGMGRHIERISNAETAYDTAFDHMATGGFGFIRAITDYVDDESHDQEIKIQREPDPFAHFPDPRCKELDYSDARYWFVIGEMSREDFQEEYPDSELAGLSEFAGVANRAPGWLQTQSVQIAEYFWVEIERTPVVSVDPMTGEKRTREKRTRQVYWCKTNGIEILERADVPGPYIPIAPVLGEELLLEGRRHLIGIVRYARTPQYLYNLWQSAMAESIALAPKAPFTATPTQVEGFEDMWEEANTANNPYLLYNPDPKAPGSPQRQFGEPPIQALNMAVEHADNDLKTTTGLYDASLGAPGPEQSGKAILARQNQGSVATFVFIDSMKRAIQHLARVIIGWIPHYYDAARIVRVVNPDGTSKTVPINQPFQDDAGLMKVFDLTVGRYDVAISTGPSYDSMRQQAADSIMQLVQAQPSLMQVVGDLLVSNFDWPMAKEISERLKKMLPPQLQDTPQNQQIPPQVQAQMQQLGQQHAQLVALVQQLTQERNSKTLELQSQEKRTAWQVQAELVTALAKIQSADAMKRADMEYDRLNSMFDAAHEAGMAAMNQAHGQLASAQQATQPQAAQQQAQQAQAPPGNPVEQAQALLQQRAQPMPKAA